MRNHVFVTMLSFFDDDLCVIYNIEACSEESKHEICHVIEGVPKKPSEEAIEEEALDETHNNAAHKEHRTTLAQQ